ncbi:hypothetical protein P8452_25964 [Trifolium repens]|nr:hypothetical protein P8452_25964 [Trifolium repens]
MEYEFVPDNRYEKLIDVDSTKGNGVYQVRVLRKWKVIDSSVPSALGSTDLVFIDVHGIKIHGSIPKEILHLFDEKILEGGVYCISSVDVRFNFGSLIPTYHRYKFVFTEATVVAESTNSFIPETGFSLIRAKDVSKNRNSFKYMVDVVGLVTSVNHDKDFYPDGTVKESVTFRLNQVRRSFLCEFSGKLVDEFLTGVGPCPDGLPIVVLQFVKLGRSQGSVLVEGIEGVTKMFVNPIIVDVLNFRRSLVQYLSANLDYSGLYRPFIRTPISITMDFLKDFPFRTVSELVSNSEVGYFTVNARIIDIVDFDPWWYPMCDCPRVFREYIGDFKCIKCQASKWTPSPKYGLKYFVPLSDS